MKQHLIALAVTGVLGCVAILAFLLIIDARSKAASSTAPGKAHAAQMAVKTGR